MPKRYIVIGVLLLVIVWFAGWGLPYLADKNFNPVIPHAEYQPSPQAVAMHRELYVADLHADPMLWDRNILKNYDRGHVNLPRMQQGNLALQVITAVTKSPAGQNNERNDSDSDTITYLVAGQLWPLPTWGSLYERAVHQLNKLRDFADKSDGELRLIRSREDLAAAIAAREDTPYIVATIFGIEGGHALEGELGNLDRLYDQGLRVVGLTHFFDNELGGSLHGISREGLTEFGRAVVKRSNELGMVIDIAHASPQMVRDVLEMSPRPVILSHGGIASACDTPRNLADELMVEVAKHGGILGVGFWDSAVCDPSPAGIARSIRRAVDVMGVNHVALGSDYDGGVAVTLTPDELSILTDALMTEGFSEPEIRQIMGENVRDFFLRYLPSA